MVGEGAGEDGQEEGDDDEEARALREAAKAVPSPAVLSAPACQAASGATGGSMVLGVALRRGEGDLDEAQGVQGVMKVSLRAIKRGLQSWPLDGEKGPKEGGPASDKGGAVPSSGDADGEAALSTGIPPLVAWTSFEALRTGCWFEEEDGS